MPKDRLADLIWGESLPVHVNATLETYVSVLRRKLTLPNGEGRGLITTEHEAYALPTAGYELDLARFDELVRLAEVAEPSARRRYLEDALALATGSVLADEPYSDWAMDERWRYERRVIDTCVAAAAAAMAGPGRPRRARACRARDRRSSRWTSAATTPDSSHSRPSGATATRSPSTSAPARRSPRRRPRRSPRPCTRCGTRSSGARRSTRRRAPGTLPRAAQGKTRSAPMRLLGRTAELD